MCFSPEVDIAAGLIIGAIGVDALRRVEDRRDLALASIPVVLAAHQLVESVVWRGLQGHLPEAVTGFAVTVYLVIALGVVPALVPWAVYRSERDPTRRSRMLPFAVLGTAVGAVLLTSLVAAPYWATIGGRYIDYHTVTIGGGIVGGGYAVAVCLPLLMSSSQRLVVFGVLNAAAFFILSTLLVAGLISLWCVWAAFASVIIVRFIREQSVHETPDRTGAPTGR